MTSCFSLNDMSLGVSVYSDLESGASSCNVLFLVFTDPGGSLIEEEVHPLVRGLTHWGKILECEARRS